MKRIIVFIYLLVSVTVSAQNKIVEDTASHPVITEPGKPIGKIIGKMMNKDGGRLVSEDGTVELIIPPDALSKKTTISIQMMTNTFQNGNGLSYRLEPSGIQFQQPVKIIFHYNPEESKDSAQLLMGIAMQDDSGQWYSLNQFTLDTVAKTISGNIDHFSIWSTFDNLKLVTFTGKYRLKVKQEVTLVIKGVFADQAHMDYNGMSILKTMPPPNFVVWWVNYIFKGNAEFGILEKGKVFAEESDARFNNYFAPDNVPDRTTVMNPVTITARLEGIEDKYYKSRFPDVNTRILIYDVAYEVKMESIAEHKFPGSQLGDYTYLDSGSFVISLSSGEPRLIETINKNVADKMDFVGECVVVQSQPGSGLINIIGTNSIKIIPAASPTDNPWIVIDFFYSPVIQPLLKYTCPPVGNKGRDHSGTNEFARNMLASNGKLQAFPQTVKFELKKGKEVILLMELGGLSYFKMTVEQLPDD